MIQQGFQSLDVLALAFYHTVFLGQPLKELPSSVAGSCFHTNEATTTDLQTKFFLFLSSRSSGRDNDEFHQCKGSDWVVLLMLFLMVHAVSWGSRWLLWEPFARWHMDISVNCFRKHAAVRRKIQKFSQSANQASFHFFSALFAWRILRGKAWLWSIESWGDAAALEYVGADLKFYFLLYAARYISDLFSLVFEFARSDTMAYVIHHVATVFLVLFSAHNGIIRIGGVIMFFFDWADPFMLIAKSLLYLSHKPTDWYQWFANRCFEIFAVTFFLTRDLFFYWIVYVSCCKLYEDVNDYPQLSPTSLLLLRSMLIVLAGLNTYWLGLIIRVAINQYTKGKVEDIRELCTHEQNQKQL